MLDRKRSPNHGLEAWQGPTSAPPSYRKRRFLERPRLQSASPNLKTVDRVHYGTVTEPFGSALGSPRGDKIMRLRLLVMLMVVLASIPAGPVALANASTFGLPVPELTNSAQHGNAAAQ